MSLFMVFDVESVGLHGPAFAVGWVVKDRYGFEHDKGLLWIEPTSAIRSVSRFYIPPSIDLKWVYENCRFIAAADTPSPVPTYTDLRRRFWGEWLAWKRLGAYLCADVPWPVEANFLSWCVEGDQDGLKEDGPYPLIDIASVRLAVGLDPLGEEERLPSELPKHNPLADARQSARLLFEAMTKIGDQRCI